jgi:hypothetical protein
MLLAGGLRGEDLQLNWLAPQAGAWHQRLGAKGLQSDNAGVAAQTGHVIGYRTTSGR